MILILLIFKGCFSFVEVVVGVFFFTSRLINQRFERGRNSFQQGYWNGSSLDIGPSGITLLMNGRLSIILSPGTLRRNSTTNGKKPLNNWKNPYNSRIIPTMGHPRRTTKIPPKKKRLALILLAWKKNLQVRSSPTIKAIPARNRIFPIAKSPLSKSKTTPRNRKKPPKPTRPIPIFWVSVGWNMIY